MAMILASLERTRLRISRPADLDYVMEAENRPSNRKFAAPLTREQHRSAQESTDKVHIIVEADFIPAGFAIISGVESPAHSIELLRLVIADENAENGPDALKLLKRCSFARWEAHRLFLSVRSDNSAALSLYESEGFRVEGTLRDCLLADGEYQSITFLSILKDEYVDR